MQGEQQQKQDFGMLQNLRSYGTCKETPLVGHTLKKESQVKEVCQTICKASTTNALNFQFSVGFQI